MSSLLTIAAFSERMREHLMRWVSLNLPAHTKAKQVEVVTHSVQIRSPNAISNNIIRPENSAKIVKLQRVGFEPTHPSG